MPELRRALAAAVLEAKETERCSGLRGRLQALRRLEDSSADGVTDVQRKQLNALLLHAFDTTEFYRRRIEAAGLERRDLLADDALGAIPLLTRDDIREHGREMVSRKFGPSELRSSATGGTTDTPVPFFRDLEALRQKTAVQMRIDRWAGYAPGDKTFMLWGARIDFPDAPSWRWRMYERQILGKLWAPTSLLNEAVLAEYVRRFNSFKPRVVYAYPTPLTVFCEFAEQTGTTLHRPAAAICTAEALAPHQRELIERVLQCKVFEQYGSRETGMVAGECRAHAGMHLHPAATFIELLPIEENGLQQLVVTDLLNFGMPLIRYQINDCAFGIIEEPCTCGLSFPRIAGISGRVSELLQMPDGSKVPGVSLTNRILKSCPGLKKVQIIQEELDRFVVKFVPSSSFSADALAGLREDLSRFFSSTLGWEFIRVDDIPRERSGKTRFCISRLGTREREESLQLR